MPALMSIGSRPTVTGQIFYYLPITLKLIKIYYQKISSTFKSVFDNDSVSISLIMDIFCGLVYKHYTHA